MISDLTLTGSSGSPLFAAEPNELTLEASLPGKRALGKFRILNAGGANLWFNIAKPIELHELFVLEEDLSCKTTVLPGESKEILLNFKSDKEGKFSTEIHFQTNIGDHSIRVNAECDAYRIFKQNIPEVIDFGIVNIAEESELSITIENDCRHSLSLCGAVLDNLQERNFSKIVQLTPNVLEIKPNLDSISRESGIMTFKLVPTHTKDERGLVDSAFADSFPIEQQIRQVFELRSIDGEFVENIPVQLQYNFEEIQVLVDDRICDEINFGEVAADSGRKQTLQLYNGNSCSIAFQINNGSDQFEISPNSAILESNSQMELSVALLPYGNSSNIPKIQEFSSAVMIQFHVNRLKTQRLTLRGFLIDVTFL